MSKWQAIVETSTKRRFRSEKAALRWVEKTEATLKASNAVCDNDIWTSVELIYETRWDCPTTRLATAEVGEIAH